MNKPRTHAKNGDQCRVQRNGRRDFLVASTIGFAGWAFGSPASAMPQVDSTGQIASSTGSSPRKGPRPLGGAGRARSTILFFLCGGASHLDTWDMKPDAPAEYRGPFQPIATSAPGVRLCEHLPMLARQAHHLAVVNSVGGSVNTNDHHAGYYYNLTGHVPDTSFRTLGNNRTPFPDDWPFMGSVVAAKRPPHPHLPSAITLPHRPSRAPYTRPGQFAARLGVEHDPLYVFGSPDKPLEFRAPALTLQDGVGIRRLTQRNQLRSTIDQARKQFEQFDAVKTWSRQQRRALDLLASSRTAEAFDVSGEPAKLRERYGDSVNAMSLMLARRLVEAEVPFITVFWMENQKIKSKCKSAGGWDTHGNNFNCLKDYLLPEFDRAFSALIEDLEQRGLLDDTLLLVTSEMGRKPKIGDPRSGGTSGQGRDHWTHCLTDLLVGGGIRGGQTYGSSDRLGQYPSDLPVTPADVTRTVYHAMDVDNLTARDGEGRVFNLLEGGQPIVDLF